MLGLSLHESMPICVHDAGAWASAKSVAIPKNAETTKAVCANVRTCLIIVHSLFALQVSSFHSTKNHAASLAPEREDLFPVVLHVDHGPTRCWGGVERLIEFPDRRGPIVGPFAFCIGVVNDQAETSAAPRRGVLKHLHVAVGVSESRNWTAADILIDPDGLAWSIVDEVDFWQAHELRLSIF